MKYLLHKTLILTNITLTAAPIKVLVYIAYLTATENK